MNDCTAAVLLLLAIAVPPLAAIEPPPTAEELRRLAAGDVIVTHRPVRGSSVQEQIGRGVIAVPPERVFRALTDWAHLSEYMPFVKESDATPQADGSVVSFQRLQPPPPNRERHYKVRATARVSEGRDGKVWQVTWVYIPHSGNIVGHYGTWTLTRFGAGQTLATCVLFTDPGGVPGWATNLGMAQTMPYIFSGLRQHVHRSRYDPP